MLEAQAVVEGQLRVDAPVVLHVAAVVVGVEIERRRDRDLAGADGRRVAEQERREGVAVGGAAGAAVRGRHVLVEVEEAGAVARDVAVDADLAEVAADLEGVAADERRPGGVGAGRLPVDLGRVDGAERLRGELVVAADADAGELLQRDLVEIRLREAERARVEGHAERVVVGEARHPEAQAQHRAVAHHPRVVQREDLRPPHQDVVERIGEPRRLGLVGGAEVVGVGLVGLVVEIEARDGVRVAQLVRHLGRVELLELVLDQRRARVVGRAVRALDVGERQVLQHRRGRRVDAAGRDPVAGERLAGQRIVDGHERAGGVGRLREVAGAFERRRHRDAGVARLDVVVALGREPEERAVAEHRPADGAAAEVVRAVRLAEPGLLAEVVVGLAPDRAGLHEAGAVQAVGAGPQRRVEHAAAGAAHLGIVGVDLHLHVLERLDARVGGGAVAQVGDGDAVERVVVATAGAAAERQQRGVGLVLLAVELGVAGGDHRRHRRADQEGGASGGRQRLHVGLVEDRADRRVRSLDPGRLAGDVHRLLEAADLELHVQRQELLRADLHAALGHGLEARHRDLDAVQARREVRQVVLASRVGHRRSRDVGLLVDRRHFGARHDAGGIVHGAADAALIALGRARTSQTDDGAHDRQHDAQSMHTPTPSTCQSFHGAAGTGRRPGSDAAVVQARVRRRAAPPRDAQTP